MIMVFAICCFLFAIGIRFSNKLDEELLVFDNAMHNLLLK